MRFSLSFQCPIENNPFLSNLSLWLKIWSPYSLFTSGKDKWQEKEEGIRSLEPAPSFNMIILNTHCMSFMQLDNTGEAMEKDDIGTEFKVSRSGHLSWVTIPLYFNRTNNGNEASNSNLTL